MKVKFEGLIKLLTVKSLASLDKEAELKIRFSAEDDDLISKVNQLMRADETVQISLGECKK